MASEITQQPGHAPTIRTDVAIEPFDAVAGDARYLVCVDRKYFVADGAVVALLEALADGGRFDEVASAVNDRIGSTLDATTVAERIDALPRALFGDQVPDQRNPLLVRCRLFAPGLLAPLVRPARHLFRKTPALCALAMLAAIDGAMLVAVFTGTGPDMTQASWVAALALTLLGTLAHELGHVAACARFGARHDGIGVGLYWFWPTFYAEVHDAWRLPRPQRAVVDAGGLYFQGIYLCVLGAVALATGAPSLWLAAWFSHYLMLHTLNPVMKFDGYWLLSDLSGHYNLHARIRDIAVNVVRHDRRRHPEWPRRRDWILLVGFVALAVAYFSYVIHFLSHNIASTAGSLWRWVGQAGEAQATWGSAGDALWLALLLFLAFGVARGVGRGIHSVVRG